MTKNLTFIILDSKTLTSSIIKFFTRSKFSHTAIFDIENDAWIEPAGTMGKWIVNKDYLNSYKDDAYLEIYQLSVLEKQYDYAMKFYRYLGNTNTPYNWLGVIGFVIPFFTSNGGYFCSEGCWEGLRFAEIVPIDIPGWKFSPDEFRDFLKVNKNSELIFQGNFQKFKQFAEKIKKEGGRD